MLFTDEAPCCWAHVDLDTRGLSHQESSLIWLTSLYIRCAGPRKRRRKISEPEKEPEAAEDSEEAGSGSEEEALDIGSDSPDTEASEAESEPDARSEPEPSPKQQKPKAARKTGHRAVKVSHRHSSVLGWCYDYQSGMSLGTICKGDYKSTCQIM